MIFAVVFNGSEAFHTLFAESRSVQPLSKSQPGRKVSALSRRRRIFEAFCLNEALGFLTCFFLGGALLKYLFLFFFGGGRNFLSKSKLMKSSFSCCSCLCLLRLPFLFNVLCFFLTCLLLLPFLFLRVFSFVCVCVYFGACCWYFLECFLGFCR